MFCRLKKRFATSKTASYNRHMQSSGFAACENKLPSRPSCNRCYSIWRRFFAALNENIGSSVFVMWSLAFIMLFEF